MNFCPNCGSNIENGMNFCPNCGYVFKEYKAPDQNEMDNPFENVSGSYKKAASALEEELEQTSREYSRASEPDYSSGYLETAPKTNIYGIISLVCGIVGIPLFFLLLIPNILAIVFGIIGLNFAKNNISGKGTSIAGIILGCIMICVFILIIVISVLFFSIVDLPGIL